MESVIQAHARMILRVRRTCAGALAAVAGGAVALAAWGWLGWQPPAGTIGAWSDVLRLASVLPLLAVVAIGFGARHGTRPPESPALALAAEDAPELHELVAGLAECLDVHVAPAIRLSPGCESWVEPGRGRTVLVIGSPILWWLRVNELRALLAPLVAAAELADDRAVTTARRFVRRLDQACRAGGRLALVRRPVKLLLDLCRHHAEELERNAAWMARVRAQEVDPAGRVGAHEQADLASVAWHRLLLRVATPAWDQGLWPETLHAGLVKALDQLAHRDHLATELADRRGERPASTLLRRPEQADSELSRMAAGLYRASGVGADPGRPVPWEAYTSAVTAKACRERALAVASFDPPPVTPAAPQPSLRGVLRAVAWAATRPGSKAGDLLGSDVQALLECALVAGGDHRWVLDWLDGSVLVDAVGRRVKVAAQATRIVDRREVAGVCAWLTAAGVAVDAPLSASVPPAAASWPPRMLGTAAS